MRLLDRINQTALKVPIWPVYLLCLIPVPVLLFMGFTGGLGREPISALEHELGKIALQFLIVVLCITPLRQIVGLNLIRFRRTLGILTFIYVALHLLTWVILDVQSVDRVWADIIKRPYITIGMSAFVLMLPLVATSNNKSVRTLGTVWRKLHMLTYPVVLLGAIHFIWVNKVLEMEPLVYLAIVLGLLALRVPKLLTKAIV